MREEIYAISLLGSLGLSSLAVGVGCWLSPSRGQGKYLMFIGSMFSLLGVAAAIWLFVEPPNFFSGYTALDRFRFSVACGGLSLGTAMFATGFLMDRLRRRKKWPSSNLRP